MLRQQPNTDTRMAMVSGELFDFDDPAGSTVTIEDIATPLSNICRFAGQTRQYYSVAQHSVNCSLLVPDELRLTALLHEISEPFISDIPSPVKWRIPAIRDLAHQIEAGLAEKFGYVYPFPPEIKVADLQMMKIEKEKVKLDDHYWALLDGVNLDGVAERVFLQPMLPAVAREFFLARYRFLTNPEAELPPIRSVADTIRERIERGDQPFFAWGEYDEESKRTWLQTGNC